MLVSFGSKLPKHRNTTSTAALRLFLFLWMIVGLFNIEGADGALPSHIITIYIPELFHQEAAFA